VVEELEEESNPLDEFRFQEIIRKNRWLLEEVGKKVQKGEDSKHQEHLEPLKQISMKVKEKKEKRKKEKKGRIFVDSRSERLLPGLVNCWFCLLQFLTSAREYILELWLFLGADSSCASCLVKVLLFPRK